MSCRFLEGRDHLSRVLSYLAQSVGYLNNIYLIEKNSTQRERIGGGWTGGGRLGGGRLEGEDRRAREVKTREKIRGKEGGKGGGKKRARKVE